MAAQLVMHRIHLGDRPTEMSLPAGYTLRPYDAATDRPSLIATLADSFQEHWDEARLDRELTATPDVHVVYVIAHGDRVVGTAASRFVPERYPDAGYVHWVGVATDHLRHGLASALLARVLQDFADRGYPSAVLETDDFRIPAIRAYLRFGFLPVYAVRDEDHRERWAQVFPNIVAARPR